MKKYFLVLVLMLSSFCVFSQTDNTEPIVQTDSLPSRQEMMKKARKSYGPWMLSVGGGGARWLAILPDSIDKQQKKYFNSLLWGYTIKGSAAYFLKFGLGFGFQYHAFHSKAKLDSSNYSALGGTRIVERISMQFLATSIQYRHIKKNGSGYLNFGIGLGYFVYNDIAKLENNAKVIDKISVTGKSIGVQIQASYNYRIDPRVSFGLGIGINNGILTNVKITEGNRTYTDTTMAGSLIHFDLHAKITIIL